MVFDYSRKEKGDFIFVCTEESEMGGLFRRYQWRRKYHKMFCPMPEIKNSFYVIYFGNKKIDDNWINGFMKIYKEEILRRLGEKIY